MARPQHPSARSRQGGIPQPEARGRRGAASTGGRTSRARARRQLSQNFLADPAEVRRIVRAAQVGPEDLVVEIGAGEGALTRALARECRKVLAYEVDPVLADRLRAGVAGSNVACVHADFLRAAPPRGRFAVVGNIPYSITSGILRWCLRAPGLASATLVTQLEFARKRTGDFGRWTQATVETWPRFDYQLLGRIPRHKFRPVPRVDSAILRLRRRGQDLLPGPCLPAYRRLVAAGFTGVGGSLDATLRRHYPRRAVKAAFAAAGIAPGTVVAYVAPDQWITLFRALEGLEGTGVGSV